MTLNGTKTWYGAKTWLALGLSAAALVGCNKPADNTTTNETNTQPTQTQPAAEAKTVAITAIVEHPSLDAVRAGVIEELKAQGYTEGQNLTINFQSAQGNMATANQIAKQFAADNPDVVVAIATPSAQAMAAASSSVPIVFSAVTDPVEAKLVASLTAPGKNITGASDALPYDPQIELMRNLVPNVKNVGFVYSPGEVNSTIVLKNLKEKLAPLGINVVEAPAAKSSDIALATQSLVGKVDLIYTSTDNNVSSAYEALTKVAGDAKIPLISGVTDLVERGASAGLGVNYNELGRETGKIVVRILNGEKPGDIAVYVPQKLDLYLNKKNAALQGITFPDAMVTSAAKVTE